MLRLWLAFKFALSALLAMGAVVMADAGLRPNLDAGFLAAAGALLFLATWPWITLESPSRVLGWAILVVASGALLMTVQVLIGGMTLPAACNIRGSLTCHAMNLLHAVGGRMLAALPVALITGFLIRLGVRQIRKPRW